MPPIIWVGLGGFLGATARYLLSGLIASEYSASFPYGTFVINISGCFILGFFIAFAQDRSWIGPGWRLFFAIGFVGAYTTFSTFAYESIALTQEGQLLLAAVNVVGSMLAGGIAVFAGLVLGSFI